MARTQTFDTRLLLKVSRYYYENELTQKEISQRLNLSRPKVSRLLTQAREMGLVKISVVPQPGFHTQLESQLEEQFGLDEAVVVEISETASQAAVSREIGMAASEYFERVVAQKSTVGISWGTTLRAMVDALSVQSLPNVHVVQLLGGLGAPESDAHVTYILRRLVHQTGSRLSMLNMPGIVDSTEIKDVLLEDSHVQEVFDLFSKIEIAFVGIGAPTSDSVVMRDGTIIRQPQLKSLMEKGAVGDVCLRFFDQNGRAVESDVDERVVGISFQEIQKIKQVVGLAGGPQKIAAIKGAMRAKLVNILITDHMTAAKLLKE